jgi:lipopolysaccharide transport system permease protein
VRVLGTLIAHRGIVFQMARRDMIERYRGSMLGLLWSLLNPLFMLAIYTYVFTVVFRARWPGSTGSSAEFAVNAFAGIIIFTIFAESVTRAPTLVLQNANLVKKVIFPLEVLPWVTLASSLFHAAVSFAVLVVFVLAALGRLHPTALLFPVVVIPVVLLALGTSWFLASIGVFFRDTSHTVGLLVTALMFVSPIFYPLTAIPAEVRWLFEMSPLVRSIEDFRSIVVLGVVPDLAGFALHCLVAAAVAWLGLWWFMRTKHAFADVL